MCFVVYRIPGNILTVLQFVVACIKHNGVREAITMSLLINAILKRKYNSLIMFFDIDVIFGIYFKHFHSKFYAPLKLCREYRLDKKNLV